MTKLYNFSQFITEAKKQKAEKKEMPPKKMVKKSTKKKDQDGDGDQDFADAKIAQYTAGGMDKGKAMKMSRKFNK